MACGLRFSKTALHQGLHLVERRHFPRRRRYLQPEQFKHPGFQRSISKSGHRQSLQHSTGARRRQTSGERTRYAHPLRPRMEPPRESTPVARNLRNRPDHREIARGSERIHRRVHTSRKVRTGRRGFSCAIPRILIAASDAEGTTLALTALLPYSRGMLSHPSPTAPPAKSSNTVRSSSAPRLCSPIFPDTPPREK